MNLMRNMSIRSKLMVICMLTSSFALFIAALVIYGHELRSFRSQLVTQYELIASAVAPLSAAALDVQDNESADETLRHFEHDPAILSAHILDASNNIFASFERMGKSAFDPAQPSHGTRFVDGHMHVYWPVVSGDDRVGTIFVEVALGSARQRAFAYAGVVAVVLLVSGAATFLLSSVLVRFFARPIIALAETTKRVSAARDYSLRAEKSSNDELGDLIDNFNEMLREIQGRDSQLEAHSHQLEAEVAARTEEIRKFALAVEQSPNTTVITDTDGHVEYVNQQFTETTGYTLDEAMAADPEILKAGKLGAKERRKLTVALESGHEWRGEFENTKKGGDTFWESASVAPLRTVTGTMTHFVWIKEDITDRKKAEASLRESEDRYALAAQGANDGLWDWDLRSNTIYFSSRWKAMLGYWDTDIAASPDEWFNRIHADDIEKVREDIDTHLRGETPHFENEFRMLHRDGAYRWMLSRGVSVLNDEGQVHRFAGSQTDITDRKKTEEKLFFDASHDNLTGLPNRGLLLDRLNAALQRSGRNKGYKFAVLFLDLDRFKVINDSLGHQVGDALLIEVSRRLGLCCRGEDVIARLGGDEFAVLLEGIEQEEDPIRVAERIQQELTRPYRFLEHEIFTSTSIGIALSSQGYEKHEDILRDADVAMYRAKSLGKARFAMFDTELHDQAIRRLQLENDLRRAVGNNELTLHYQPILSLASNSTIGFEALVRWDHPERGMISPVDFIPIAEETGLIGPMGWWILRAACEQIAKWREDRAVPPGCTLSVNISGKQFLQRDFVKQLKGIMASTGVTGPELKLEVTESVIIDNPNLVTEILRELRALNLELCIDDFGTGYSSLNYLHRFPFDVLKIDRSFIGNMENDREARGIVQTIVGLAKNLNLYMTAEGVENEEQAATLRELGCDSAQGYHFARPMPGAEVPEYFERRGETLRQAIAAL